MISTSNRQTDGTVELTITVPWSEVEKLYTDTSEKAVAEMELPGFRKGKAPKAMAEAKLTKSKIYEEVLRLLIPKIYNDAITEQKLHPVVTPKIQIKEATENKDWIISALTCEKPDIDLGDYKKAVSALNNSKKNKIWVPGDKADSPAGPATQNPQTPQKPTLDELLKTVFENVKIQLPALLIEHEVNQLLSQLIDDTKKLGLSVEQYLSSTGRNTDSVHHEYEETAKRTLTLEFALEEIADKEGILVADDDIETVIKSAKSDAEREALAKEKYYLASVLRRQKTLDFLATLY